MVIIQVFAKLTGSHLSGAKSVAWLVYTRFAEVWLNGQKSRVIVYALFG